MKKTWIILCFLFVGFYNTAWCKTKITNVEIQENSGITQIIFDMDALIYPEATLNKSANQIVVTIPEEADWDIPEINEAMIGFFEGYKLVPNKGTKIFTADVLPGIKMVDSYSINDDPTKPQFVIELSKDTIKSVEQPVFNTPKEKESVDPFTAESLDHKAKSFTKKPYRTRQAPPPIRKRTHHVNPMIDKLDQNIEAQTSAEKGSMPDWVKDAQKNMKRK